MTMCSDVAIERNADVVELYCASLEMRMSKRLSVHTQKDHELCPRGAQ